MSSEPDRFDVTFKFYGMMALFLVAVCAGLVFGGWVFGLGVMVGAGFAGLLACFAIGMAAPW